MTCRRCDNHPTWHDSEWCWRCIHDTCCHQYPRVIRGRLTDCAHGDVLRRQAAS